MRMNLRLSLFNFISRVILKLVKICWTWNQNLNFRYIEIDICCIWQFLNKTSLPMKIKRLITKDYPVSTIQCSLVEMRIAINDTPLHIWWFYVQCIPLKTFLRFWCLLITLVFGLEFKLYFPLIYQYLKIESRH